MACKAKHTELQLDMPKEFFCPACGMSPDVPAIQKREPAKGADKDCKAIHEQDTFECVRCNWRGTGIGLAEGVTRVRVNASREAERRRVRTDG